MSFSNTQLFITRVVTTIAIVYFVIAAYGSASANETPMMFFNIIIAIILFEVRATLMKMHK